MLNEKVFKPPSQFVTVDNKNNLFDYSPLNRGVNPSCAFDIPHQITVLQTNFPKIKFADVKAIGAILYVLDDVASEVLTAMNVYDPDYLESDLNSFEPNEIYKITSESEDIKDVNDIEEEINEVESENDDDVVEHQIVDEEVEPNFVSDEALFSAEENEDLIEEHLFAESSSENADDNVEAETAETEIASPEITSLDEDEDEEFDQEEIEEQEDEIDSDSCDSEIAEEFTDQEDSEEQDIDRESSSASDVETEVENNVEENSYAADDSLADFATDISSNPQAELIEIPQTSEVTPESLISGVANLLEKLSLFTEERKRTPYLTSPVNAETDITSSQSSEAETLREYSITAPAA